MPAFIRNKNDEARWEKAKQAANKERSESDGDVYWGLVNHIYQNMKKNDLAKSGPEAIAERIAFLKEMAEANPELSDKILDALKKARGDEDEDDYGYDHQNYGDDQNLDDEDLDGLTVTDDPFGDEDDEASKWLRENDVPGKGKVSGSEEPSDDEEEEETPQQEEVKPKRGGYSEWKAHGQYTPEQSAKMKELVGQGYSDREAERMVGAHKGPKDFQSALKHTVKPSQPSEKMLGELKELAGHWLDRADRHSKLNADPEKNPQKYAAGKMMQAHEEHSKDFNAAYNDFLNSDELKGKKGLDRHKAIQTWKSNWKSRNPEYTENIGNVSESQKHYKEAGQARKQSVDDALKHILTGGYNADAMSAQEAAQHVGGDKTDEGYTATTIKDPSASFAERNKGFVDAMRQKQAAAAPPVQQPKKDPMVVIRRRANPEQMDRFTRVQAARTAQGIGKKPEGVE